MKNNLDKRIAFEVSYDRGVVVSVAFDTMEPGVVLPMSATLTSLDSRHVVLNYSKRFDHTNTVIDNDGVSADLSFSKRTHYTFVPWSAIRAIVVNNEMLESWPEEPDDGSTIVRVVTDVDDPGDGMTFEPEMAKWVMAGGAEG